MASIGEINYTIIATKDFDKIRDLALAQADASEAFVVSVVEGLEGALKCIYFGDTNFGLQKIQNIIDDAKSVWPDLFVV